MIIQIGDNRIETKYNIGDVVTVCKYGTMYNTREVETSKYYLDEKDEKGFNLTEEKPLQYTITDIKLSCSSGYYSYSLWYNNSRCIFPSGGRGCEEREIIGKVPENEIYKDKSY
jgi:hypothetical protein